MTSTKILCIGTLQRYFYITKGETQLHGLSWLLFHKSSQFSKVLLKILQDFIFSFICKLNMRRKIILITFSDGYFHFSLDFRHVPNQHKKYIVHLRTQPTLSSLLHSLAPRSLSCNYHSWAISPFREYLQNL